MGLDSHGASVAISVAMERTKIDVGALLAFALPRVALGVSVSRIAKDYEADTGIKVPRRTIAYHLGRHRRKPRGQSDGQGGQA